MKKRKRKGRKRESVGKRDIVCERKTEREEKQRKRQKESDK